MSIYLPECNAQITGSGGSVSLALPAAASYKPANRGLVFGMWVETPANGYENNVQYNVLSKGAGNTGGNDGYLRFTQAGTQLQLSLRNAGVTYMDTSISGLPPATRMLLMVIQTAAYYHLVACEPGGTPIVSSIASTTGYTINWSAVDVWSRFGIVASVGYGHYGPIEEAFFLLGEFPESAGVPNAALIQNIASGAQDLATLDAQLTGTVAKKWRYRMMRQDDLADAYGIAGALTVTNGGVDKAILSGASLRPVALRPTYCRALASQVSFASVGVAATATATIMVEGGTYSGITPAKIQARLRNEGGTVLSGFDWTDMDAAPSGGVWAPGQFSNVPMTAGWLTCDFRAVDGGGAQIGDIVSSAGWKGAGFNVLCESQSQGTFLFDTGAGMAVPAEMRLQAIHSSATGTAWRAKKISSLNANARLARGVRQMGVEINALFPGVPISVSTVGVQGQTLTEWASGGAFANMWSDFKAFVGKLQPFVLYMIGHSNPTPAYEAGIGSVVSMAVSVLGAPMKVLLEGTPRYAGSGTGSSHTDCLNAREGSRDYAANNPTTARFASHPQPVKCDSSDTGPHPMDADVGQGRHGAMLAWGLMGWARAVEDEPITLTAAQIQPGGTTHKLVFGAVNAGLSGDASASSVIDMTGTAAGAVDVAGAGTTDLTPGSASAGSVDIAGQASSALPLGGSAAGAVGVAGAGSGDLTPGNSAAGGVTVDGAASGDLTPGGSSAGTVSSAGSIDGAHSGTLDLSGSAAGGVVVAGDAGAALPLAGAASGTSDVAGAASSQIDLTGTATGDVAAAGTITGQGAGTIDLTSAATATVDVAGAGTADLTPGGVSAGTVSGATGPVQLGVLPYSGPTYARVISSAVLKTSGGTP